MALLSGMVAAFVGNGSWVMDVLFFFLPASCLLAKPMLLACRQAQMDEYAAHGKYMITLAMAVLSGIAYVAATHSEVAWAMRLCACLMATSVTLMIAFPLGTFAAARRTGLLDLHELAAEWLTPWMAIFRVTAREFVAAAGVFVFLYAAGPVEWLTPYLLVASLNMFVLAIVAATRDRVWGDVADGEASLSMEDWRFAALSAACLYIYDRFGSEGHSLMLAALAAALLVPLAMRLVGRVVGKLAIVWGHRPDEDREEGLAQT